MADEQNVVFISNKPNLKIPTKLPGLKKIIFEGGQYQTSNKKAIALLRDLVAGPLSRFVRELDQNMELPLLQQRPQQAVTGQFQSDSQGQTNPEVNDPNESAALAGLMMQTEDGKPAPVKTPQINATTEKSSK